MSEWSPCPRCGTERENLCACLNPKCADYVALTEPLDPTEAEEITASGIYWKRETGDYAEALAILRAHVAAEVAKLQAERDICARVLAEAKVWIDEAKPLLEKGGDDKARLDWLENNRHAGVGASGPSRLVGLTGSGWSASWPEWRAPTVRAALDLARKATP